MAEQHPFELAHEMDEIVRTHANANEWKRVWSYPCVRLSGHKHVVKQRVVYHVECVYEPEVGE
jgi:hypothetical protein